MTSFLLFLLIIAQCCSLEARHFIATLLYHRLSSHNEICEQKSSKLWHYHHLAANGVLAIILNPTITYISYKPVISQPIRQPIRCDFSADYVPSWEVET